MRKTKIICTMGPRLFERGLVRQLMLSGMDVARFNFSHDTHEGHLGRYRELCALREELGLPIATMLDTKGPEIRIGTFQEGRVTLEAGQLFTLTAEDVVGDCTQASISYKGIFQDVEAGGTVLIDDGLVEMKVEEVTPSELRCRVINSGVISDRKGVNIPGVHLSMPYLSEKDRADILFGVEHGFDFVAASFARSAEDVLQIRNLLRENGCEAMRIIAKIENMEGVQNIDDILRVSDGVMVARGDMGVEIPLEEVPVLQKLLIRKTVQAGKPVITATQMLDSMMKNPRPTRAESTDVANAIYDGTSAIMLSGETAAGDYPVEALQTMVRIAQRAESDIDYIGRFKKATNAANVDVTTAISHATVTSAIDLKASAIITVTKSGVTARVISRYRPDCQIVGCTTSESVWRQLNLSWGTIPLMIPEEANTDDLFEHAVEATKQAGLIHDGELVVLTAGVPLGIPGTTNLMKVHLVGHMLIKGVGVCGDSVTATLCVARNTEDALKNFQQGEVLVTSQATRDMLPLIRKASALVLEDDNPDGLGVIAGVSLNIPVIIGAVNATHILKGGSVVTVNAREGTIYCN